MALILRKLQPDDKRYFASWWRDLVLIALTSGVHTKITDRQVDAGFSAMLLEVEDRHYIIELNGRVIGHIALIGRDGGWHETQIVIGERGNWGRGYGTKSIRLLLDLARQDGVRKIFLEVRPDNLRAIRAYEKCGFRAVGLCEYPENRNLPLTLRMEWDGK